MNNAWRAKKKDDKDKKKVRIKLFSKNAKNLKIAIGIRATQSSQL